MSELGKILLSLCTKSVKTNSLVIPESDVRNAAYQLKMKSYEAVVYAEHSLGLVVLPWA